MQREKNPNQRAFKIVNKKAPVIMPKPPVEEVGANIGSEKNVSFAMSIALQMKEQQRKADEAKKAEPTITYKKRNVKYSDADLESFRKKLLAARAEIAEKFAEYIIDVDKQSIEATAQELAKIARNG